MLTNYIVDVNKFHLAGPPAWWLRQLAEFDPSLVIVPSRNQFVYRLAQRRRLNLADKFTQDQLWVDSDTKMLAEYGLVPVTSILATASWNPLMFEELRRRASWRQFNSDAEAIAAVEKQEAEAEAKVNLIQDDINTIVARDAWNLYQMKTGLRTHGFKVRTPSDRKPSSTSKSASIRIQNPSEGGKSRFAL